MEHIIEVTAVFLLILATMVLFHEAGHFLVAKLFHVDVQVFSFGFGMRLFGFTRGGTDYRVSLIPLGGYVRMAGESDAEPLTGHPGEFRSKPRYQRVLIALAGPGANFALALAVPAFLSMLPHDVPAFRQAAPIVGGIDPGSPAAKAGFQTGDLIVKLDGHDAPTWQDIEDAIAFNPNRTLPVTVSRGDTPLDLSLPITPTPGEAGTPIGYSGLVPALGPSARMIIRDVVPQGPADRAGLHPGDEVIAIADQPVDANHMAKDTIRHLLQSPDGGPLPLEVLRSDQHLSFTVLPELDGGTWRIGVAWAFQDMDLVREHLGPGPALRYSIEFNARIIRLTALAISQVFQGTRALGDSVAGPIGIARITGQAMHLGPATVFSLLSLLSLNLGLFNLLPIPVLDGGLIFMVLMEALLQMLGIPFTAALKERMTTVGFLILAAMTLLVFANDLTRIFHLPA
jgi:regulator of sigma E protease